ncbi:hypothetical protein CK203_022834 [Vitis vinifera]|uniref:DUF4378 domain-containing protein n=1 Tax=Vitis vinifera TaxID=29760 RepID=A0A438IW47_VITVI|nr:hypothetical protein CK203_022834 [Vitis vinifera]
MSALNSSFAYHRQFDAKKAFQIERRPRMLKDFLIDDSNSCSSNGFKSFPRKASHCTVRNLLECDGGERGSNSNKKSTFLRSRSTAAATTISAFQKASEIVINAVKSPSFLQRSLKRRFWRRNSTEERGMTVTVIRVKDIVRMRSFRDVIEEKSAPSDSTGSITTTATTSSNGSSWCGSDFTADYVQSWSGNSEEYSGANAVKVGEKYLPGVGDGNANTTTRTTMSIDAGELRCEEKEQHSPVSVLDCPFTEDAEPFSFFIRDEEEEEAEEKAMQLLDQVKAAGSVEFSKANLNDDLLLEFFRDELMKISRGNQTVDKEVDAEILKIAEAWLKGEFEWGVETEKEACIRDMERGGRWRKFEEEEEEMALELEVLVFEILEDELLGDLFVN